MIYNSILDLVGNTSLVRLRKEENEVKVSNELYCKLEKENPCGSIKDRAVKSMLLHLMGEGKLKKGSTIIEPTSGNTGISLCAFASYLEVHAIIVMPSSMSLERRKLIQDYGGELVLVDGGMKECNDKAIELKNKIEGSIILDQFNNEFNSLAHYDFTAREIFDDLKDVDYIFAGIGTGGTISGIAKYVRENNLNTKVIGVEPAESPLINGGEAHPHLIQGIGANFIPSIYRGDLVDEVITVEGKKAIERAKEIVRKEGLLVGISSGAALEGAIQYMKEFNLKGKKVVCIFPDTGERYQWN